MISDPQISLPRVAVIFREEQHRRGIEKALGSNYKLSMFDDVSAASDAMAASPPNVALLDSSMGRSIEIERLLLASSVTPIVFISKKDVGPGDLLSHAGKTNRFLDWPLSTHDLTETINELINEKAEKSWEKLPEVQHKPLKLTIQAYQAISSAFESGAPVSFNEAAESCMPLVDAVKQSAHHDLLVSVQSHHNYTYVHSMRVATLLTLFGHGIGITGTDLLTVSTGGLLHDVGKMVTPPEILNKPGKLSDEEWPLMQEHVVESGTILHAGNDVKKGAYIIAEQHHEKIDGTGYPLGLKGSQLNELARMSAICDIFGALTDERSYKPAFSVEKSFGILESMDKAIDQKMLAMFKEIFIFTSPGSTA